MTTDVNVPELPESVSDATIVLWRKQVGDTVKRDESLLDLETDKVVLEVPSPIDGVLTEILQEEGAVVEAGQLLAKLDALDVSASDKASAAKTADKAANKPFVLEEIESPAERVITPSAQKMLAENNINANEVSGSGKDGRVLKEDVIAFMQQNNAAQATRESSGAAAKQQNKTEQSASTLTHSASENIPGADTAGERIEKRVPMTRLRARVAERLLDAQHNAAILTTFNEVNMQPVMDLRNKYKDLFAKKYDVKLGFMSFFIKASIEALKRFPAVNASIDGNDIVYHGYFDIGVAVAAPRGLVVPVLRNVDQMSLADIERNIVEYVDKAKNNQLAIDEMTGGTFSLTNGGVFGSMLSTPIINPPQSAILGMHKIQQRPVVENGEIVARPMMYLALSYDHRIIDGAEAVQFLVTIKDVLEDPARSLIGV
ncbi:MAG TPA: 2-oxoglutarate dehydrogenase complex dihydrolipoyllysine-residue succinyltransferase [Gammaproteobacteria bacterium]